MLWFIYLFTAADVVCCKRDSIYDALGDDHGDVHDDVHDDDHVDDHGCVHGYDHGYVRAACASALLWNGCVIWNSFCWRTTQPSGPLPTESPRRQP